MTTFYSSPTNAAGKQSRTKRVEAVAAAVSLAVIALLAAIDVVHTAPADAPVVQATFDVAPAVDAVPAQSGERFERWAADDSAQGTRPDAVH